MHKHRLSPKQDRQSPAPNDTKKRKFAKPAGDVNSRSQNQTRMERDIRLAKANLPKRQITRGQIVNRRNGETAARRARPKQQNARSKGQKGSMGVAPARPAKKKGRGLSDLFTSENIQESLKQVNNLRSLVKNGLGYLRQADQLLETLYATSSSLKETGVLDKLIKQKGRNLTTEDFTNILVALMNSPAGAQMFRGKKSDDGEAANKAPAQQQPQPSAEAQNPAPNTQFNYNQPGYQSVQGTPNPGQQMPPSAGQQQPFPQQPYPQQPYNQPGFGPTPPQPPGQ